MVSRRVTWIIATRNDHKVEEIRSILGADFNYFTLKSLPDAPTVIEDAPDFAGNAAKKSVLLARWLSRRADLMPPEARESESWVLADDSGLAVDALNGAPGVHSARFAALDGESKTAGNSPDAANNAKLIRLLANVPAEKRRARFRCVIAVTPVLTRARDAASPVCYSDESELRTQSFQGDCEGLIAFEAAGAKGFGYDPFFIPNGFRESFAQLGEEVKNRISHRAKALQKLRTWLDK